MHAFDNCKVLVVGGAGFVGSNLVRALLQGTPREVVVVDNMLSAERCNVPDDRRVRLIEASITRDDVLPRLPGDLDFAFHLATFHGNQNSIADPLADHENNTLTSLKLFERLKSIRSLRRVVYSSAGCTVAEKTFDRAEATTEDAPVSLYLDSPYQISKIIGEFYGNYYFKLYGLPVVKARFQNVYGPGEILGAGRWRGTIATVWRNVTPSFVYRAIKGMPLRVENGGIATRDFIYVADIVDGLLACAARGEAGGTYNLASGRETSILELAELINELTGNRAGVEVAPKRTWDHSGKRYGSVDKAQGELGFAARTELRDGLMQTIEWTRQQLPLIESCIARHAGRMHAAAA
jgi:nucleoside-diphosphate-sugar epimerase